MGRKCDGDWLGEVGMVLEGNLSGPNEMKALNDLKDRYDMQSSPIKDAHTRELKQVWDELGGGNDMRTKVRAIGKVWESQAGKDLPGHAAGIERRKRDAENAKKAAKRNK